MPSEGEMTEGAGGEGDGSPKSDIAEVGSPGAGPVNVPVPGLAQREDAVPASIKARFPCMTECAEVKVSKYYCTICNREVRRKIVVQHCASTDHGENARIATEATSSLSFEVNLGSKFGNYWRFY